MKKNILLVEYAAATVDTIKEILSHPMFHVTLADEGEIAKSLINEKQFDMVITAAMLPKFHGFSLSQFVADNFPATKIVIISGVYKGYEYRHKAITQYKADDFFEKPLNKIEFRNRVLTLLNISEDELSDNLSMNTARIPQVDTAKIPTMKKIKEEEQKLTSEDLFGDFIAGTGPTPNYEIKLGDENHKKTSPIQSSSRQKINTEEISSETIEMLKNSRGIGADNLSTQQFNINIDSLVNEKPGETKDTQKFKKIEDDISKKFEDTLSGLGISSNKIKNIAKPTPPPPVPEPPAPKEETDDYEILGLIARGGMAEIYKAKKRGVKGFEKIIAFKKILSSYVEDEKYIEMFVDEAKIAAELTHPNIVQIYDLGQKDDYYFIAMEYVLGKDLRLILRKLTELDSLLPQEIALYLILQILSALNYAHAAKDSSGNDLDIVHRDVSPPNILVSYSGNVKLTDFGVSKATIKMHQTLSGALKGKLLYMSPEQAKGEIDIDNRSDLYSVGIILFELITGQKLFIDSSELLVLKKVQDGQILIPRDMKPDIDPELESIILKTLAKDKNKRYSNALEMSRDIESYLIKHYDRLPDVTHISHFLYGLFKEELESNEITFDLKPLSYEIKKITPKQDISNFETMKMKLDEQILALDEEPQVTMQDPIAPPTQAPNDFDENFTPIIEIDFDKEKEEVLPPLIEKKKEESLTDSSGFKAFKLEEEPKKKPVVLILVLALLAAIVVVYLIFIRSTGEGPNPGDQKGKLPEVKVEKEIKTEDSQLIDQNNKQLSNSENPDQALDTPPITTSPDTTTPQKKDFTKTSQTEKKQSNKKPEKSYSALQNQGKEKDLTPSLNNNKIPEKQPVDITTDTEIKTTSQKQPETKFTGNSDITDPAKTQSETPMKKAPPGIKEGSILPLSEVGIEPVPISTPQPRLSGIVKRSMTAPQTLIVSFLIGIDGNIETVKLIKKSKIKKLNNLIIDTIKTWKFKPALKKNIRVKVWKTKSMTIKK